MKRTVMIGLLLVSLIVLFGWFQPAFGDDPAVASAGKAVGEAVTVEQAVAQWSTSAHALADVNCSSCHQTEDTQTFVAVPDHESCRSCHESETETFLLGKHGIRLLEGESPLTPALARLPMKAAAHNKVMNCNACHDVHAVNTMTAAVDACLTCHNDTHSLNYADSPHGLQFAETVDLPRPGSDSVSCATCHLPRYQEGRQEDAPVWVNHNNTYTLKPRDRLVKDVCMNCHGMEFSYSSIFDDELVEANFAHPPTIELETLEMARVRAADRENIKS